MTCLSKRIFDTETRSDLPEGGSFFYAYLYFPKVHFREVHQTKFDPQGDFREVDFPEVY